MAASRSDALVVFGVTGDLAHKMIFPALYAMAKRGTLKVPVIGVALPKWSLERLHKRVTDSIEHAGGVDDRKRPEASSVPVQLCWRRLRGPGHVHRAEKGAWQVAPASALSCHPAFALRNSDQRTGRGESGRQCARHRREALWTRPRFGAGTESGRAEVCSRKTRSFASITSSEKRRS